MISRNRDSGTRRPDQIDNHHLIPRSRFPVLMTKKSKNNLKEVRHEVHVNWHRLFVNMTPFEVVESIIFLFAPSNYFTHVEISAEWKLAQLEMHRRLGDATLSDVHKKAIYREDAWNVVFGEHRSFFDVVVTVIESWSPPGYFTSVLIIAKGEDGRTLRYEMT